MLNYLKISNLALMRQAEVEFHPGFNVITGETGAGKSILLGTVALLLGARADKSLIRQNCDRCEIVGSLSLNIADYPETAELLHELAIEENNEELRLRRVITHSGSRCYINDTPVNLQTLAQIGNALIDVHSANEQYSLLSHTRQLFMLDRHGKHHALLENCKHLYDKRKELAAGHAKLLAELPSLAEAELLEAMTAEITKANPEPDEDIVVNQQFSLAANAREILNSSAQLTNLLTDGENSITEMLAMAYRMISDLNRLTDNALAETENNCAALAESVRDLAGEIEHFANHVDLDEETLQNLENRLGVLQNLKRRYGPRLADVLSRYEAAKDKLHNFHAAKQLRDEFAVQDRELLRQLTQAAGVLTEARRKAGAELSSKTEQLLHKLGLPNARFEVRLAAKEPGENGADEVEFYFSANKGVMVQPLRLMASSGELSRVMLAMKAVLAAADTTNVLIFDEIDVNIGGETAREVARTIADLAKERQVLCISHLPQVAACGDYHYMVAKHDDHDDASGTVSEIIELTAEQRIAELARMLGGGRAALAHAEELYRSQE